MEETLDTTYPNLNLLENGEPRELNNLLKPIYLICSRG